jgi:hypothetical protein
LITIGPVGPGMRRARLAIIAVSSPGSRLRYVQVVREHDPRQPDPVRDCPPVQHLIVIVIKGD